MVPSDPSLPQAHRASPEQLPRAREPFQASPGAAAPVAAGKIHVCWEGDECGETISFSSLTHPFPLSPQGFHFCQPRRTGPCADNSSGTVSAAPAPPGTARGVFHLVFKRMGKGKSRSFPKHPSLGAQLPQLPLTPGCSVPPKPPGRGQSWICTRVHSPASPQCCGRSCTGGTG